MFAVKHIKMEEIRKAVYQVDNPSFQLSHVEKMIKNYASYPTRDRIIFAPLHSKNYVCRYRDLVLWAEMLKKRLREETSSTPF